MPDDSERLAAIEKAMLPQASPPPPPPKEIPKVGALLAESVRAYANQLGELYEQMAKDHLRDAEAYAKALRDEAARVRADASEVAQANTNYTVRVHDAGAYFKEATDRYGAFQKSNGQDKSDQS